MPPAWRYQTVSVFALWMLLCFAPGASAQPDAGRIAFLRGDSYETVQLSVLDVADGSVHAVGPGNADGPPHWSPDGRRIAYTSATGEGERALYVAGADGKGRQRISSPVTWNMTPRWTRSAGKIAFTGGDTPGNQALYVYDFEDDETSQWGGGRVGLMNPVWLEGRAAIDFLLVAQQLEWGGGDVDLDSFTFDAGGKGMLLAVGLKPGKSGLTSELVVVTSKASLPIPSGHMPSSGEYMEWNAIPSPNGRMLAFESNDGGDREIYVLTFNKGVFDITNHREADWNPVWAPDSRAVAFESFRDGRRGVYEVLPDTVRVSPIAVTESGDNWAPAWSPGGDWIAFVSNRDGDAEIYVTDREGENTFRITNHPGPDWAPVWQPVEQD